MPAFRQWRPWSCLAALLLVAGAFAAQGTPVDEYHNASRRALASCGRPFEGHGVSPGADQVKAWRQCADSAKTTVGEKFDAAMASTAMDPAGRAALQRYQAAFLKYLTGLPPVTGEAQAGYDQRQAGLRCALSHAWTEFEEAERAQETAAATGRKH